MINFQVLLSSLQCNLNQYGIRCILRLHDSRWPNCNLSLWLLVIFLLKRKRPSRWSGGNLLSYVLDFLVQTMSGPTMKRERLRSRDLFLWVCLHCFVYPYKHMPALFNQSCTSVCCFWRQRCIIDSVTSRHTPVGLSYDCLATFCQIVSHRRRWWTFRCLRDSILICMLPVYLLMTHINESDVYTSFHEYFVSSMYWVVAYRPLREFAWHIPDYIVTWSASPWYDGHSGWPEATSRAWPPPCPAKTNFALWRSREQRW